jgi:hypothetical protein
MNRYAKINNDAEVTGYVAVNSVTGWLKLGKNVLVHDGSTLEANYVEIGNASSVDDIFANTLKLGFEAVVRGATNPATLPVADPFCQIPTFTCGTQVVNLPPGDVQTLTPRTYGFARVANGATLHLAPGVYTFCDVKTGRDAQIVADGPVLLQITGNLRVGTDSYFGPAIAAPPIAVYVAGRKVRISQSGVAVAQITAPFAKGTFGRDSNLTGYFCADQSKSDKHITLVCPTP